MKALNFTNEIKEVPKIEENNEKEIKEEKKYKKVEIDDWRTNASIIGLIKYLNYYEFEFEQTDDYILFDSSFITEDKYLLFAENYFKTLFHHCIIEDILNKNDEITTEMQKTITEKLKANSIMKKIFHSSIDLTDFNLIKTTINENRLQIIEDTFKNGKKLYAKFNNPNKILTKTNDCCRITGFDFDTGRKSKSMAYKWDKETLNISDDIIFDFIPFAFSKSDESFFINNNYSIKQLVETNNIFETEENFRKKLIENLKKSSDYLNYDVEVILKNIDAEYYETLFLRKNNIELLNKIENFEILERKIKINDNYYIDLQKDVFNRIINNIYLDDIILLCLKKGISIVNKLIEINMYLYGVNMNDEMKRAFATAKEIARNIEENKISSYKQKLISCITFKDYEKFCNILLQLSMYSKTEISFAYSLFENFEENKNLAYTFINALGKDYNKENKTGDKNE